MKPIFIKIKYYSLYKAELHRWKIKLSVIIGFFKHRIVSLLFGAFFDISLI